MCPGTKPLTGASILKLISEGKFHLETPVHELVDPVLASLARRDPAMNFSSMGDLWGAENVGGITVGMMLNMTSGIPDFDTAKGHGSRPTDSLRAELCAFPPHTPTAQPSCPFGSHCKRLVCFSKSSMRI